MSSLWAFQRAASGLAALLLLSGLLGACGPARTGHPTPIHVSPVLESGERPPLVAGIRLGDAGDRVREVLGRPLDEGTFVEGTRLLDYWQHGIVVVLTRDQGVAMIGLLTPTAPLLAGVRIGDPLPHLVQQWGPWQRRVGNRAAYGRGAWGIIVVVDTAATPERVQSITFGWSASTARVALPDLGQAVGAP